MRLTTHVLPDRAKAGRSGFTLIEVLVVVAIIALLISILLPSLARAREQARNTLCLSNLGQQGKAVFMYAHDYQGHLPYSYYHNSIEVLDPRSAKPLVRILKNHPEVFFCPENVAMAFRDWTPQNFKEELALYEKNPAIADPEAVHVGYWWVANPPPPPSAARSKFIDSDEDGELKDEYVIRLEQRDLHALVISTDQTGQENRPGTGWFFYHGSDRAVGLHIVDPKGISNSWKNNLYADSHAASVFGFKVKPRWGKIGVGSVAW